MQIMLHLVLLEEQASVPHLHAVTIKTRTTVPVSVVAGHHFWIPWLAETCHYTYIMCYVYKYMAILHTVFVVSAVHDKKYLLLVLYSLDSYHKWPGYSVVVSLAGGTQQNTTRLQKRKCTTTFQRAYK